jgi:hypothetical protein
MEEPIREVRKLVDEPVAEFKKTVSNKPALDVAVSNDPASPPTPDVPPAVGP